MKHCGELLPHNFPSKNTQVSMTKLPESMIKLPVYMIKLLVSMIKLLVSMIKLPVSMLKTFSILMPVCFYAPAQMF